MMWFDTSGIEIVHCGASWTGRTVTGEFVLLRSRSTLRIEDAIRALSAPKGITWMPYHLLEDLQNSGGVPPINSASGHGQLSIDSTQTDNLILEHFPWP